MTDTTLLDRIDPSGSIEEAAAAAGVSRRELVGGLVAGGSLAALGSALFADEALAQSRPSRARDRRILAFALLLGLYGIHRWLRRHHDPLPARDVVHIVALGALGVLTNRW